MKNKPKASVERYIVPAVEQSWRILFSLARAESRRMSLIEISKDVNINKSKVFSILNTLQKFGVVERNGDERGYSLGPGLIGVSRRFLDNLSAPKLAEPLLEQLAKETGGTAALGLIAEKNVFVASRHEGGRPVVVTMRVGHRFPISYGCHGKAIAAFLPEKELQDLLREKKLYFHGEPSKFDRARLEREMRQCRKQWFAEDLEEMVPGLNAVAAPVLGPNQHPIGYIVALGLFSADAVRQSGPLVAEAGKALSRQLGAGVNEKAR